MSTSIAPSKAPLAAPALRGVRILSLALNLPGPAALTRLRSMGATCIKAEPPAPAGLASSDPMLQYNATAYDHMHQGIRTLSINLKTEAGQARLHKELARTDVLLTSFRPSALRKLGLGWKALHKTFPQLNVVTIVGAPGERAEEPGHDLTYQADAGLITGTDLPASLLADMGGALMASEAVLAVMLARARKGQGVMQEVALSTAAEWLALPRHWGLTTPNAVLGGTHAGYRIYPCKNGRVALAALEPHFAAALCKVMGLAMPNMDTMFKPETHQAVAAFVASKTRAQLDKLAAQHDIPLHTMV